MFHVGSIYRINVDIPLWNHSLFGIQGEADWLQRDSFIAIIDMKTNFFIIQTHLGVFKTSNLHQYVNFRIKFEKIA